MLRRSSEDLNFSDDPQLLLKQLFPEIADIPGTYNEAAAIPAFVDDLKIRLKKMLAELITISDIYKQKHKTTIYDQLLSILARENISLANRLHQEMLAALNIASCNGSQISIFDKLKMKYAKAILHSLLGEMMKKIIKINTSIQEKLSWQHNETLSQAKEKLLALNTSLEAAQKYYNIKANVASKTFKSQYLEPLIDVLNSEDPQAILELQKEYEEETSLLSNAGQKRKQSNYSLQEFKRIILNHILITQERYLHKIISKLLANYVNQLQKIILALAPPSNNIHNTQKVVSLAVNPGLTMFGEAENNDGDDKHKELKPSGNTHEEPLPKESRHLAC